MTASSTRKYRAAWLPHQLPHDYPRQRDEVAVDWILDQAVQLELPWLCYAPTVDLFKMPGASEYFRQFYEAAAVDTFAQRPPRAPPHAVLAFVESDATLDLAVEWAAGGGALCCVPLGSFKVVRWATTVGALRLS
jgi:hypothetical protein